MASRSPISPEDQKVTFVELFFDLVFVFSVTQVVILFHHGFDWLAAGQAILLFWLVWWAWTQFTWALNAADTTHHLIALGTLVATAVAFFMAVALPDAFHDRALWFAITYVLVRLIGLALYTWVAAFTPDLWAAVRSFGLVSMSGLVAVLLGGLFGGTWQYLFWGIAIILDVVAANVGGQAEGWNLHPEHFAERHGLFVIIALGETLIVTAGAVTGVPWTGDLITVAMLAVAITCALWWSYFPRAKPLLDHALESSHGAVQSMLGRDVFSLLHFIILCGVIAYAAAVEAAVAHPTEPLGLAVRLSLGGGLLLFVGGMALALWRATRRWPWLRMIVAALTVAPIIALGGATPLSTLSIALAGILLITLLEEWRSPRSAFS